jgi:hypothetical protein
MLVEQAKGLRYGQFARCVAYWGQLADPEGTDASAEARHAARRLHLSATFGGSWALNGLLDPINGAIVAKALGQIEQELFEADLGRGQGPGGRGGAHEPPGPHAGPAPGRRPGGDGPAVHGRGRGIEAARAAVQRAGGL